MSEIKKINILEDVLGNFFREGDSQLLFKCPKCDHHKRKLSINMDRGLFKCWVCDWSGRNLYKIVRNYGSFQQKQAWRELDQQVEINNFADKLFGSEQVNEEAQKIKLPSGFISLANKTLPTTAAYPLNYLKSRGITKEDILKWKIGYCTVGDYASRIVVPSFDLDGDSRIIISP